MKNIFKWFVGLFIVMALMAGLEMAKFALLRPPDHIEDYAGMSGAPPRQPGPSSAFDPNGPRPEKHPPFGPSPAGIEWAFALADFIDLLVYVLILLPLFYGAYLLHNRTLHVSRFNTRTTTPILSSFKPADGRSSAESDPVSTQQSDYLLLDNHMLDQLL